MPPIGPMIIAPMNIGISVPTMMPAVAIAPTTPPRCPLTTSPPVKPISNGNSHFAIGPTISAKLSFGIQPAGMNNAVMNPQAMNAPIFGMTIALRNRPNFCMSSCIPLNLQS